MDIRNDRQKGMSYTEIARKYHIDPRTAKKHAEGYPEEILYDNMKQVVVKRLLKQEDSTLERQFEDFAGSYGFKPVLCRPYRGQTKGKVERTVQFVRDNFMVGIKYDPLDDLNGQALAWCNKVNGKIHATRGEIPFERLKKEGLDPLKREYIIDKTNLRRVQKDCRLSRMDIQGADLFFQLIARRYEKTSTIFTSNKTFSQWNEVFADVTIASAILDRVLYHCTVINIKGESYRLKERTEYMKQKQHIVNTLFEQGSN
jgi:hypothetical protein